MFSFLQKCKLLHIFPTFLSKEVHRTGACLDLLRYELTQKTSTRRKFQLSHESARSPLKTILSPLDYNHICSVNDPDDDDNYYVGDGDKFNDRQKNNWNIMKLKQDKPVSVGMVFRKAIFRLPNLFTFSLTLYLCIHSFPVINNWRIIKP